MNKQDRPFFKSRSSGLWHRV